MKKKIKTVLFSDLDGTFLDHFSYSCRSSLPVLEDVLAKGILTVFCSSKTAEEIHRLQTEWDLHLPFISENGGGIYIPESFLKSPARSMRRWKSYEVIDLGVRHGRLLRAFRSVKKDLGLTIRGFTDMSVEEVSRISGLRHEEAELARRRDFDEPFVVENETPEAMQKIEKAFESYGLQVTRGGRFLHLTGNCDKGKAVLRFTELLGGETFRVRTAGIGDSPNDIPMLREVDVPILVMKPDGNYDSVVLKEIPDVRRAGGVGPAGWAKAIRRLCNEVSDFASS